MTAVGQFFHFLALMFPVAATGAGVCLAFWVHNLRKLITDIEKGQIEQAKQIGTLHTLVGRMYLARPPFPDAADGAHRATQWDQFDKAYSDFQAIIARINGAATEPGS